jgi:hypothetical protein
MGIIAIVFYSPTLKRQIAAYEAGGAESAEFQELGVRGRMIGIVLAVLVFAILILMVVKPAFTSL